MGRSFSGGASILSTATSLSSSNPITRAPYTAWSPRVTLGGGGQGEAADLMGTRVHWQWVGSRAQVYV